VDDLLNSLSTKFASVSSEIFEKIEAMSKRLDQMEATLQQQSSATASSTSK
jgi:heat shock factor-binding protein 1